ncbi:MAG: hypothetical protein ACXVCP_06690 [Bdellovibrio sp.]
MKNRYKTFTKIARSDLYNKKANGMTLSQIIKTIQWLSKTVFGNNRPTVTAKLIKSKHMDKQQELSEISLVDFFSKEEFQPTESILKSVMTMSLDKNLKFKGGHAQIITDFDGYKITMVDSNDLSLRFTATLEDTVSFDETTVPLFKYTEETLKEFPHKLPVYFSPFAVISVDVGNISDYSIKARIQETIRNIFKGKKSGTP